MSDSVPVVKTSRYAYRDTIERLSRAIVASGSTVFATIDQAGAAARAGLSLRPTTLIVFGNPAGGTPFMDDLPLLGLDLPLKFLVWEEEGVVKIAYSPMSDIARRYGVSGKDAQIAGMDRALAGLSAVVE